MPAPSTSTSSTSTLALSSRMPTEIGKSLPASMRNPVNLPPLIFSPITAAPVFMGAARSTASRATRLRSVTPAARWTCSLYSPPGTSTMSPACAADIAAAMLG